MDGKRFDDLTRSFSTRQSRRGVLKTIGGGIAAGLATLGVGEVGAAPGGKGKGQGATCGGPGKPCKRNNQCCEFAGLVCLDGGCTCPANTCASGACAPACTDGKVFNAETCACECVEQTCCSCRIEDGSHVCLPATTADACSEACVGSPTFRSEPGATWVCDAAEDNTCQLTCAPD